MAWLPKPIRTRTEKQSAGIKRSGVTEAHLALTQKEMVQHHPLLPNCSDIALEGHGKGEGMGTCHHMGEV